MRQLTLLLLAIVGPLGSADSSHAADADAPAAEQSNSSSDNTGALADREEFLELYGMLAEAVAEVEMNYARPVDRRRLFESAIEGMLSDLDSYSAYLGPEKLADYERRFSDRSDEDPQETVIGASRTEPDGAWRYVIREEPRVAYVAVVSFAKSTPGDLAVVVKNLVKGEVDALVLDLRFNAGGLLTAAVDTGDLFLAEGKIVSTEGRSTKQRVWMASAEGSFAELPLAVLVNRQSASGAEVVAAALQDHNRAAVVGERSWGKGSVQNVFEIDEGRSAVKLTTSSYHRPSGVNIHRFPGMTNDDAWGVQPDSQWTLTLPASETRAIRDHRQGLLASPTEQDAAKLQEPVVDRQLDLAVDAVISRLTQSQPSSKTGP